MELFKTPRSHIIGAMRRSTPYRNVMGEARRLAKSDEVGPRGGVMQVCAHCKKSFKPTLIQVDHINPVIALDKKTDDYTLDEIWARMVCKKHWKDTEIDFSNLQCLCLDCHEIKTNEEKATKKKMRDALKKPKIKKGKKKNGKQ